MILLPIVSGLAISSNMASFGGSSMIALKQKATRNGGSLHDNWSFRMAVFVVVQACSVREIAGSQRLQIAERSSFLSQKAPFAGFYTEQLEP